MSSHGEAELRATESWRPVLREHVLRLQVIVLGMAAGPAFVLVVGGAISLIADWPGTKLTPWLPWALIVIGLGGWIWAETWSRYIIRRKLDDLGRGKGPLLGIPGNAELNADLAKFVEQFGDVGRVFTVFFLARFVRSAVLEGFAFLAGIVYFITQDLIALGVGIGLTIGIGAGCPTVASVTQWIVEVLRQLECKRAESFPSEVTTGQKD